MAQAMILFKLILIVLLLGAFKMTYFGSTNYLIEVAKGKIPGVSQQAITGQNPQVGKTFETLWDSGGNLVQPTGAEIWEIVSDNAGDMGNVITSGLDTAWNQQVEVKALNGTTPVVLDRVDWYRGYNINTPDNIGNITLRVAGGGNIRAYSRAGLDSSFNGTYTVPLGKSILILQSSLTDPKNEDAVIRNKINIPSVAKFTGGDASVYQSFSVFPFKSHVVFPEKTDLEATVKSSNEQVSIGLNLEFLLMNETLPMSEMVSMGIV